MITDDEVGVILPEIAKQYLHAPADRSAEGLLRAGLARLVAGGLDASDAEAMLLFSIHGSSLDVCLQRREGEESVGDAMTMKDLSLVKVFC
jgi:hypothetical protein